MKTPKVFFLIGIALFALSFAVWGATAPPGIDTHVYPALYKSKQGLVQKVRVSLTHTGEPENVTLTLAGQTQKGKLKEGANQFLFEIPEVQSTQRLPLVLTKGKEKQSTEVEVKPVRHWQMNMVQHTHTDIGYTRSQTEILAEHLRYIDYALD